MAGNKQKMRYFTRLRYMKVRYKDRQAVDKKKKNRKIDILVLTRINPPYGRDSMLKIIHKHIIFE